LKAKAGLLVSSFSSASLARLDLEEIDKGATSSGQKEKNESTTLHIDSSVFFFAAFLSVFASLREEYLARALSRILLALRRKTLRKPQRRDYLRFHQT
jgi:hypothetical protein